MGDFICANVHARLAISYQSVVATGQLQLRLLSANKLNDVDTKRVGTVPTAAGMIARLAYARVRQAGIELDSLLTKAALTEQQITDRGARFAINRQIRFLNLAASALQDELGGWNLGAGA